MKRIALTRPPLPALPMEGGCHCGAVRYARREIWDRFSEIYET